jgi:haloacid dehalogenase superfamily, subfamily IA, variant 1 with third motif having Dx(3-4)D or Dx(3-4)E
MASVPIRAVLFDKDGTLLDFQKTWGPMLRVAADLAARGDRELARRLLVVGGMDPDSGITAADSVLAAGNTAEIALRWIEEGSPVDFDSLVEELDGVFTGAVGEAVVVTDLLAFFSRLKARGLATGIASSDSETAIRLLIARFGMEEVVDFVAGYDSGHGVKPQAGMLLAFAEAVGVSPAEVAMVGDNLHDMAMAAAAGAGARFGVLTGTGTRETLAAMSDACLASIEELEGILFAEAG